MYKSFKFAVYSNRIVMIMSSKQNIFNKKQILRDFGGFLKQNDLTAGISGVFENLYDVRKYYEEALEALCSGVCRGEGERIFMYGGRA